MQIQYICPNHYISLQYLQDKLHQNKHSNNQMTKFYLMQSDIRNSITVIAIMLSLVVLQTMSASFGSSILHARVLALQQLENQQDEYGIYYYEKQQGQDDDYVDYVDENQEPEQETENNQQQPSQNIQLNTLQEQNKPQYLKEFKVGQMTQNFQDNISYDEFVDRFKGNQMTAKDPQIMFYKASVLQKNIVRINKHNSQPGITYILGVNEYADLTLEQFHKKFMATKPTDPPVSVRPADVIRADILASSNFTIDWSECADKYTLKFFKMECDLSYALAAIDAIQITMKIHKNRYGRRLSIQEAISCSKDDEKNSQSCYSGYAQNVFQYSKQSGIGPLVLYPTSNNIQLAKCKTSLVSNKNYQKQKFLIKSYGKIARGDCSQLVYRLRFRALTVRMDSSIMTFYKDGTLSTEKPMSQLNLDHSVVVVGYFPDSQQFKIKNSWGTSWGLGGYAVAAKNTGICQQASYPILFNEKAIPQLCKQQQ